MQNPTLEPFWIQGLAPQPDQHVAFRGTFVLEAAAVLECSSLGSGWYEAWLNGVFFFEGPLRYPAAHPEYDIARVELPAGRHVLALHAHHLGVSTRLLPELPPFLMIALRGEDGTPVSIEWRAQALAGHRATGRRINGQLPWIEWVDTRLEPAGWVQPEFELGEGWRPVERVTAPIGEPHPPTIAAVASQACPQRLIAEGLAAENFGYEDDDPATRFFLRDLDCGENPPEGLWRRYDLGRVRLMRPDFLMDLPAGAVVEFAYAETLRHGRVAPHVPLSVGPSCNLDHFVARGGQQRFRPLHSKGGRYVELHITHTDPQRIRVLREAFMERAYYSPTAAEFVCNDSLLNRIWSVGVETFRACAEDALIDNPTRERGQWTGDLVGAGLEIAASAFSDLRLIRRGLRQAAQCRLEGGMIAGLSPGQICGYTSYALQWITACVRYWELSGDLSILEELHQAAVENLEHFERHRQDEGLDEQAGLPFIDWGYDRGEGPIDIALSLHYLESLRAMTRWAAALGREEEAARQARAARKLEDSLRGWLTRHPVQGASTEAPGFHVCVLALRLGLIEPDQLPACLTRIKQHLLACFPNRPGAARNAYPGLAQRGLITPYFAHYSLAVLALHGEMDFALDQYRACWGWALEGGRSTWVEVFDTRWSLCHQWSGCPTWQLSRFVLGLHPRQDRGAWHFDFIFEPGSLREAHGRLPVAGRGSWIEVEWTLTTGGYQFSIASPAPLVLNFPREAAEGRAIEFQMLNSRTGEPWLVSTR